MKSFVLFLSLLGVPTLLHSKSNNVPIHIKHLDAVSIKKENLQVEFDSTVKLENGDLKHMKVIFSIKNNCIKKAIGVVSIGTMVVIVGISYKHWPNILNNNTIEFRDLFHKKGLFWILHNSKALLLRKKSLLWILKNIPKAAIFLI